MVYKSIRLKNQLLKKDQLKLHIITISSISFIFPIVTALTDIEQWPVYYPNVSGFLRVHFLPIILIISVFEFVYLMKRINKK